MQLPSKDNPLVAGGARIEYKEGVITTRLALRAAFSEAIAL